MNVDPQWSRSARTIYLWTAGMCMVAQVATMSFFYLYWASISLAALLVAEGILLVVNYFRRRRTVTDTAKLSHVLWASVLLHPRPAHGVVCIALVLAVNLMPAKSLRGAAYGVVVMFGVLSWEQPTSIYTALGSGPGWMPMAYTVLCALAALPFALYGMTGAWKETKDAK